MVDAAQFYMNRVLKDYKGKWVIQIFFFINRCRVHQCWAVHWINKTPSKLYKPLAPFQLHCAAKAIVLQKIISYWCLEIEMWYHQSMVCLKNRPFTSSCCARLKSSFAENLSCEFHDSISRQTDSSPESFISQIVIIIIIIYYTV